MPETSTAGGQKLKVFISYSRRDLEFSDQLAATLEWQGFQVIIDRKGIHGAENWEQRLGQLILECDTVVFVLSPDSAASDVCKWEVEEARRRAKRFVPIVCRALEGAQPHDLLRDLNYIHFYAEKDVPGSGFGTGQIRLIEALRVDVAWLREHTRLEELAARWQSDGRTTDLLLRGSELANYLAWRDRRPADAPELTALQREFIGTSEAEEAERASAERKRLEEMAAAQGERAKALDAAEKAQKERAAERERRARLQYGFMAAVAGAVLLFLIYLHFADIWELQRNTVDLLKETAALPENERQAVAEARLNSVASYLLWRHGDDEHLDMLKGLLQQHERLQPVNYGVNVSGLENVLLPDPQWPLKLHYSNRRTLDPYKFNLTWLDLAKFFEESWGVPVPLRVHLSTDPAYPAELMRLESTGGDRMDLNLPPLEDRVFISEVGLAGAAQSFFRRFPKEWHLIPEAKTGGPYWVVPKWSIPVWNVSGQKATAGDGLSAFEFFLGAQEKPEVLISNQSIEFLLDRVAHDYPQLVKEVRAIRGAELRRDLIRRVREGHSLKGLPVFLDILTHYPGEVPADVYREPSGVQSILPERFAGPNGYSLQPGKEPPSKNDADSNLLNRRAYQEAEAWLPPVETEMATYVGRELDSRWFAGQAIHPKLQERIEGLRDNIYRRFGVVVPGIKFRSYDYLRSLGDRQFSIVALDQSADNEDAKPISVAPDQFIDTYVNSLHMRAQALRVYWLNTERVAGTLDALDPALLTWLLGQYSPTDIKLLLRSVVSPDDAEVDFYSAVKEGASILPPAEDSVRHTGWLLGSLVFWAQMEDPLDPLKMRARLRETQRARLDRLSGEADREPISEEIRAGIDDLTSDRIANAAEHFRSAIRENSERAAAQFARAYSDHLHTSIQVSLDEKCNNAPFDVLSQDDRTYLEEILQSPRFQAQNAEKLLRLKSCLFAQYQDDRWSEHRKVLAEDLLGSTGLRRAMPPRSLAWLATEILKSYDPLDDGSQVLAPASNLLKEAVQLGDNTESDSAFSDLNKICDGNGLKNWCWALLEDVAEVRPTPFSALRISLVLANKVRRADVENALKWARRAYQMLGGAGLSDKRREELAHWATYAEASALVQLGYLGDDQYLRQAEPLLRSLLDFPDVAQSAQSSLEKMLRYENRFEEALPLVESALKRWPEDMDLHNARLLIYLALNQTSQAAGVGDEVLRQHPDDSGALFVAALAQLMTKKGNWELTARSFIEKTRHEYVPYIAVILDASLGGGDGDAGGHAGARQVLKERWSSVDPSTWKKRLQSGDANVWREMLVGYLIDKVPRGEIFDVLEDEQGFERSDLRFLPLPRLGMLCEAYFYDAVVANARRDKKRMFDSLNNALKTGYRNYIEFTLAKFMLSQERSTDAR